MTNDSQQVTDAQVDWSSDEAVCKAAVDGLTKSSVGWVYEAGDERGFACIAYGWDNMRRNDKRVVAYEAQHRPKAVARCYCAPDRSKCDYCLANLSEPVAHREGGEKRVCADCGLPVDRFGAHDRNVEGFDRIDAEARPCWNKANPVTPDSGPQVVTRALEGADSGKGFEEWNDAHPINSNDGWGVDATTYHRRKAWDAALAWKGVE